MDDDCDTQLSTGHADTTEVKFQIIKIMHYVGSCFKLIL